MESFVLYSPSSTSTAFSPLFPSSRISLHLRSRPHLPRSPPSISPNPICTLRATPSSLSSISPSSLSLLNSNHLSFNPLPKPDKTHKPIQASATPPSTESPIESKPQGAKIIPLIISASVGLIVRFLIPKPIEVTGQTWQLLAIFLSTIAGLVLNPLPLGAWAFIALTTSVVTRTLSFSTAFGAFTNEVIWLIVISFFFARGFVKTGLGDRIATDFVKWLGKSTLGLSYGLTFSEAVIAPAMPSTTAREGGVFVPIIKSLAPSAGSKPGEPSAKKLG